MNLETTRIKVETYNITLETLKNLNHELEGAKNVSKELVEKTNKFNKNLKDYFLLYAAIVTETFFQ